jgi:rsbT antagonist protein RsbS
MHEVSILRIGGNIIVPIQEELHDRAAQKVQETILHEIVTTGASGLVIDVSAMNIVDSFLGRLLADTSRTARLLGAETVLVGIKREVAITLVELGMIFKDLHTAMNIEDGLELVEQLKNENVRTETWLLE